jgi:hypothetical protein
MALFPLALRSTWGGEVKNAIKKTAERYLLTYLRRFFLLFFPRRPLSAPIAHCPGVQIKRGLAAGWGAESRGWYPRTCTCLHIAPACPGPWGISVLEPPLYLYQLAALLAHAGAADIAAADIDASSCHCRGLGAQWPPHLRCGL